MKKPKWLIFCLLVVLCCFLTTTSAEVILSTSNDALTMSGNTVVRLVIPSSYIVEIPAAVSIPYGRESTPVTIGVSSMNLGTKAVKIAVDSAKGNLLQNEGSDQIPFVLMHEGAEFSHDLFNEAGETQLSVDITLNDWYKADAGVYTGMISFQVSVEDQGVNQ